MKPNFKLCQRLGKYIRHLNSVIIKLKTQWEYKMNTMKNYKNILLISQMSKIKYLQHSDITTL